ncbi:putative beta-lysine N-acetyltransferase [Clostridium vincentii]|uniref:N-acetyltransferase YodP n=1 Tax=Clostridium vincentii TaxID=52704 RepID=A0A2T0BHV1_9CLOT|nr:putative beta-lysine N-acetyltransferase [Clostridium vincentii]PRR83458.1 N-acetyltransferase YodP [Clostridium vincentii]
MRADSCTLINNYYTKIDRTKIYMDYANKCVKIIDFNNISVQNLKRIIRFSSKQHLSKIICNCDIESSEIFIHAGFDLEGKINGYFRGKDALCMSYFISSDRKACKDFSKKELIVKQCLDVRDTFIYSGNKFTYSIRNAVESDIKEMIALFSTVFTTYPSPVYDEEYLKQTMEGEILYKVAVYNKKIIGVVSANMDKENLNAEITDCATYSCYRCKGVLANSIYSLELDLKNMGFITLYSLSRAMNPSINIVLSKHNYEFTGRLINNCNICSTFEDMNIWVKNINNTLYHRFK